MKLGLTSKNRLADARAGGWRYPLTDGRTSVRGVTDAGGSVAETTDYSPLGVPSAPLTRTPYHFTGETRDGVGLQTHRARHYAPALGTWTALDPFEGVMGRPLSLNGYVYVEGDPVNMSDPSGLQGGPIQPPAPDVPFRRPEDWWWDPPGRIPPIPVPRIKPPGIGPINPPAIPVVPGPPLGVPLWVWLIIIGKIGYEIWKALNNNCPEDSLQQPPGSPAPGLTPGPQLQPQPEPVPEPYSRGPGGCHVRPGINNTTAGTVFHGQIQRFLQNRYGADRLRTEVSIVGARADGSGRDGQADAVYEYEGNELAGIPIHLGIIDSIYEIKPASYLPYKSVSNYNSAKKQLQRYIDQYELDPQYQGRRAIHGVLISYPIEAGGEYVGSGMYDSRQQLRIGTYHDYAGSEGLIYYWCRYS